MIVDVKTNVIKEIEMVKGKNKRLFAGYYKKYDDSLIYVVTLVTDVDTGAESVIFHEGVYAENITFKSMFILKTMITMELSANLGAKKEYTESLVGLSALMSVDLEMACL